jgi:diacylglycerol kinase family enzyme
VSRRTAAVLCLLLFAVFVVLVVVTGLRRFPRGLVVAGLLVAAVVAVWEAIRRRGPIRVVLFVASGSCVVAAVVALLRGEVLFEAVVAIVVFVAGLACAKRSFTVHVPLPPAEPPKHAVVVWNPRSGGGKAVRFKLADEARARGIEPIELKPGDDLVQLVRDAVARGADALAAAGGDGTQALVATIAAEHDLPFACIPSGTRNHFALDLGVDRNDVVGALDAFVSGGERRVDLAEVNGRVFVNNASLGLYAEAVQRRGYRDAKLRTILDTAPDLVGVQPAAEHPLHFEDPNGDEIDSAAVIQVSNNTYRLGHLLGAGTRPNIDDGLLGVAVFSGPRRRNAAGSSGPAWRHWGAETFDVDSPGPIPIGVDGEALVMEPPLHFIIRPGVLRVRIAPQHPGASPSAAQPEGLVDGARSLVRIARGADPLELARARH